MAGVRLGQWRWQGTFRISMPCMMNYGVNDVSGEIHPQIDWAFFRFHHRRVK